MLPQQTGFMSVKNAWNAHSWSVAETELWILYCKQNPITNKNGEKVFLFPYIAFLKVNIPRVILSLSIIYEPPLL